MKTGMVIIFSMFLLSCGNDVVPGAKVVEGEFVNEGKGLSGHGLASFGNLERSSAGFDITMTFDKDGVHAIFYFYGSIQNNGVKNAVEVVFERDENDLEVSFDFPIGWGTVTNLKSAGWESFENVFSAQKKTVKLHVEIHNGSDETHVYVWPPGWAGGYYPENSINSPGKKGKGVEMAVLLPGSGFRVDQFLVGDPEIMERQKSSSKTSIASPSSKESFGPTTP